MVAMEISRQPEVRAKLRQKYRESLNISVRPTKKGREMIDDSHPLYGMRYLKHKPAKEFKDDEYLHFIKVCLLKRIQIQEDFIKLFYRDIVRNSNKKNLNEDKILERRGSNSLFLLPQKNRSDSKKTPDFIFPASNFWKKQESPYGFFRVFPEIFFLNMLLLRGLRKFRGSSFGRSAAVNKKKSPLHADIGVDRKNFGEGSRSRFLNYKFRHKVKSSWKFRITSKRLRLPTISRD